MEQASYKVMVWHANALPESYKALIYSKWLRSLRYGNDYFKLIDQKAYFRVYHKYIERVLTSPGSVVRLAVLGDDSDVVLGFSVSHGDTMDYIHVHKDYRRKGIGTSLLFKSVDQITHVTKNGISFWTARCPNAIFNPFA